MKKILAALALIVLGVAHLGAGASAQQVPKPSIDKIAGPTTPAQLRSIMTASSGPIGDPLTFCTLGTSANNCVQLNASAFLPALNGSLLTALNASNLASGTLPAGRFPALTGDITTSAGSLVATLPNIATGATTGGSTAIPVITFNNKGQVTGVTTAAVIAPAGTLTGTTLASGVTASSLTSVGPLTELTVSGTANITGTFQKSGITQLFPTVAAALDYSLDVTRAPYSADPTGTLSSTAAFVAWWTDVCTNKLAPGKVPSGTYKIDGAATLSFDHAGCLMGVKVVGDSMGRVVFNTTGNTASPNVFIGATGGTAAAPAMANYSSFSNFTISGDIDGIVLQLGRNGAGVGLADALDSFDFRNIIVTNANSAHSNTAAGCEFNNVVNSSFINVVCDAGITAPTASITGAVSGTGGVCRIAVGSTTPFAANMPISISGILGATACNGTFSISSVVDSTHLELAASTFAGTYTSGGTVTYWIGYGDGLRLTAAAFNHFSGSVGLANCAVAYRRPTGYSGIAYGNTFNNMDMEFVNNGICRVAASGPETYQGGQFAITGKNGYVVTSAVGSGANITINNPNFGMPGNVANAIDPANSSYVQITGFYANGFNLAGGGTILTSGQLGRGSLAFDGATEFGIGMKNTASGSAGQVYFDFLRGSTSVGSLTGTNASISLSGVNSISGAAGTFLTLDAASGTAGQLSVAGSVAAYWNATTLYPGVTNTTSLGTSSARYANLFSVLGNFSGQITSSVTTGTAPFSVASTTLVSNLNAQYLSGATFAAPGPIGSGTPGTGAFAGLTVTSSFTATGLVGLSALATQATNTVVGNATSGSASPTALAVGSCSTSASALIWTTNTGFGCNTSINAATLGGATFAAPGAIGGGTPGSGAFTTLGTSGNVTFTGTSSTGAHTFWTDTAGDTWQVGPGAGSGAATEFNWYNQATSTTVLKIGRSGALTAGTSITAAAASGFYLGSTQFAALSGVYNVVMSPTGTVALQLKSTDAYLQGDAVGLRDSAGATAFLTANSTGVGIGVSPIYKLDVYESINGGTVIRQQNPSTGASAQAIFVQDVGGRTINRTVDYAGQHIVEYGSGIVARYSVFDDHVWRNSASVDRMYLTPAGVLGINNITSFAATNLQLSAPAGQAGSLAITGTGNIVSWNSTALYANAGANLGTTSLAWGTGYINTLSSIAGSFLTLNAATSQVGAFSIDGAATAYWNTTSIYAATSGTQTMGNSSVGWGAMYYAPTTAPGSPSTGWVVYSDTADGTLKAKNSSGTVRSLAAP